MSSVAPNYSDSLAFLERWLPGGPWLLTAIGLDKTGIETRAFRADQKDELRKWLEQQGAHRNIYFSVNTCFPEYLARADGTRSKKTEATDIQRMVCLHVDLDPREGEDRTKEQERIKARLTSNLPQGVPPPSLVVFSGGGYQGFWLLKEPVVLDGSKPMAEDAKRWNLQMEVLFGADHCHNIDRIMRLPGTVNRPDAKKKAKGRVEALAEVVEWHSDRVYEIGQFTKAPEVQTPGGGDASTSGVAQRVKVSGNVKRYNGDIDAVPGADKLPGKARVVIVQGLDPDEPHKFGNSRSEWLLFACCAMVRAGFDDDTMYAVITDPRFGISASVLDKGSATEKYAIRQIERAKEEAVDPWLRKLNEKHAVIRNWAGKTRIIEEVWDPILSRHKVTRMSFDDFRNGYMHEQVQIGQTDKGVPITKPVGQWWLQNNQRRQYETLVFAPGKEVPGAYNLWRGFACEARPGDCSKFLHHLEHILCRGVKEHYDYLIGWMARCVQQPASPGYSAVVMRGGMGTGKSYVAKMFGSLFGRHYMSVTDPKHLVGAFNAHLRDCVLLLGEEAFYAGDKKHESILKMLITEELITIEAKGVDAEASGNCVHLMMASNEDWVVPTSFDDRRFFVLDISEDRKEDHAYFQEITEQMDRGGREALLYFLLNYDLKGFNVRKVPKTQGLQQQKLLSMDPMEAWWYEKLQNGKLLVEHDNWRPELACQDLQTDFFEHCKQLNIARRGDNTKLGEALKKFCPPEALKVTQGRSPVEVMMPGGQKKMINRPYYYKFPSLEECREWWDRKFGGPYQWRKAEDGEPKKDEVPF